MDSSLILETLSRWVHVGSAIVVLGGSVFMRFVLMPAAKQLPDDVHETLRQNLMGRWKMFVHIGIVLFLASGLYNYIVVSIPKHRGDSLYHALLGTKIILALVVFFFASALVGRASAFEGIRKKRAMWLGVIILLAAIIVAISGFLKVCRPGKNEEASASRNIHPISVTIRHYNLEHAS